MTTIRFTLDEQGPVNIEIFDLGGRLLATPVNGNRQRGEHKVTWDGRDASGRPLPGGIYECRLTAGSYSGCLKLIIIR